MTLDEAIAEMKRLFTSRNEHAILPDRLSFAVLIEAAASGQLIPKADADLAVAAAYELTVKEVECWLDEAEWPETRRGLTMAILALAPADALAEVARLRADLDHAEKLNRKLEAALSGGVLTKKDSRDLLQKLAVADADVARLREALAEWVAARIDVKTMDQWDRLAAAEQRLAALTTPEKDATT